MPKGIMHCMCNVQKQHVIDAMEVVPVSTAFSVEPDYVVAQ